MTDLRTAITETAQAIAKANEWRPIETAPKDGTYVLLHFPGPFHDSECPGAAVGCFSQLSSKWWLTAIWASTSAHHDPDGWLPLPPPPAREGI